MSVKMRKVIDLRGGGGGGGTGMEIMEGSAYVDCEKNVRICCWPTWSFRSLLHLIMPRRSCQNSRASPKHGQQHSDSNLRRSTVTGTIFGQTKGRVSFCIQEDSRRPPLLLLEFTVPTYLLAKEMQYGMLRIALECDRDPNINNNNSNPPSLLSAPAWSMYCNGRKVGFAVKKQATDMDRSVLKLLQSVSAGAGVIPGEQGEVMYMRATYERVAGSRDSESFHLVNPVGSTGQELSIFLLRS